ncbi:MAG: glutamate-1-semialdehyde 2,1-aminomutase [Deltaproteobacteria bacterium HGW-Deltaproteobacteria-10]|nr:MAG: glutamate-1-semialdehyde 2,1-aminomutase [Deltaproteobacteria bacterium HGW-Deltaproteobacteria-10]
MKLYELTKSYQLFEEAQQYVPNGIYGPRTPAFLTFGSYPAFIHRGEGCRIWDVDGNEYIDYMCSFGTNILGLKHPKVDAAAKKQWENADCFTLPSDQWLPLAKKIVGTISGADWCVFGKNGSDVTSYAITLARIFTGKMDILLAKGSYHGSHFWCQPHGEGVPEEWKTHIHYFEYNDVSDLQRVLSEHNGTVAGIVLTPHRHDSMRDQELPTKEFVAAVNSLAKKDGFVVIGDDVRCGFRLDLAGSSKHYGFNADIQCFGKAIANGYAISVAASRKELMDSAKKIFFTGTHYFSGVPFAAALACIDEIQASGAIEHIRKMGIMLMDGLKDAANAEGVPVNLTGPPAMPFMTFANDPFFETNRFFCGQAARRGIFFHPHHNWFVCAAMEEADIRKTLDVASDCFKLVKKQTGG